MSLLFIKREKVVVFFLDPRSSCFSLLKLSDCDGGRLDMEESVQGEVQSSGFSVAQDTGTILRNTAQSLGAWVALDSSNSNILLRVSPSALTSCYWVKRKQLIHLFISLLLFAFPPSVTKLDGLWQKGNSRSSIIWCSQILWLSERSLKYSSMMKNDSKNGTVGFHAYHLQIISISNVFCEQWTRQFSSCLSTPVNITWTWSSHWILFFSRVFSSRL